MLKRQESVVSSTSSRRENVPEINNHHPEAVGCMAGVLHLFSKYQKRRRRFLTFGGRKQGINKQNKNESAGISSSSSSSERKCRTSQSSSSSSSKKELDVEDENKNQCNNYCECDNVIRTTTKSETEARFSREVAPRSPMLPPDIRRSSTPVNFGSPPSAAAEVKRRKLVVALEKCDEDLKAIGSIIEALRFAPSLSSQSQSQSQPIPVISVIHNFNPATNFNINKSTKFSSAHLTKIGELLQQKKPQVRKDFSDKITSGILRARKIVEVPLVCGSKAKRESVDEVCKDLVWGQKREVGIIGLALQDYICRDLVEEFVKDLGGAFTTTFMCSSQLPLEYCKRKLNF